MSSQPSGVAAMVDISEAGNSLIPEFDATGVDKAILARLDQLSQEVRKVPQDAQAWSELGRFFLAHGFFPQASDCFFHACRLAPQQGDYHYLLGRSLLFHRPSDAPDSLRKAARYMDEYANCARLYLAQTLMDSNELDQADLVIKEMLSVEPDSFAALFLSAKLATMRSDYRVSTEFLEKLHRKGWKTRESLLLMAEAKRQEGLVDDTVRLTDEARLAPPNEWPDPIYDAVLRLRTGEKALLSHAESLLRSRQFDRAIELLNRGLVDYPESIWIRVLLAQAYEAIRQSDKAISLLEEARRIEPRAPEVAFHLGLSWMAREDYRQAAECFHHAGELLPSFASARRNEALCLAKLGRLEQAIAAVQDAVRAQPNFVDAYITLGKLHLQHGDPVAAREAFDAVLRLRPDHAGAKQLRESLDDEMP